ncbi:MAG TPA: AAA family ATPase [Vineibacter sp.]|nr:AAA family ATPase [Vineibacter sp.]
MKKVLITGMSGTGKTTIVRDLSSRGYTAVDLDGDAYSMWVTAAPDPDDPDNEVKPGQDWVWREDRVHELLSRHDDGPLFVSGCASNMTRFVARFDLIVLLSAPDAVIVARLGSRQGSGYGQSPEEVARVLRLRQTVEPHLRQIADLEIDTSDPDQSAATLVLQHMGLSA